MSTSPQPEAGFGVRTRLLSSFAALGAGAVAIVIVALLVRGLPAVAKSTTSSITPSSSSATTSSGTTTTAATSPYVPGFPSPPSGAFVLAGEGGTNVIALAVVPSHDSIRLQASIVPENSGTTYSGSVRRLALRFSVKGSGSQTASAAGAPCGTGCFKATVPVKRPLGVVIELRGQSLEQHGAANRWVSFDYRRSYSMPVAWPPQPAGSIVQKAAAVWSKLNTLVDHDSLGDGNETLQTLWKYVSPDRLQFTIAGDGGAGIIIGNERWDQERGSTRWIPSPQLPVTQPRPFWQSEADAYLIGSVSDHGRPAWKVSFFDPHGGPAWFTIIVDKGSLHTTDLSMTAQAHFMHELYGPFNSPISIKPPT